MVVTCYPLIVLDIDLRSRLLLWRDAKEKELILLRVYSMYDVTSSSRNLISFEPRILAKQCTGYINSYVAIGFKEKKGECQCHMALILTSAAALTQKVARVPCHWFVMNNNSFHTKMKREKESLLFEPTNKEATT